ncbi:low temperature requirement protein A [Sporolactobacillus shoreae]|uniref:Low temperature requirement protein A n=1 Tax=Sporolactobacillus shoreae TaxID=1465501 RepID=A0A4Z0GPH2_9BACL|nr:low temperature requirement protein A [Sporolactobacillus shoreae]TGA98259.1 low temperature requirement protein A [Sporolactobacillus shoreae]
MVEKLIGKKEVSTLELFYDLIFAYAISRMTEVLHLVSNHTLPLIDLAEYLMMMLVFWTIWTYQTVYANRFLKEDLGNSLFLIFDMFWVVILSQSLNEDFASTHFTFAGSTSVLFLSIAFQYYLQSRRANAPEGKKLTFHFSVLLAVISLVGFVTILPFSVPYSVRFAIYAASIFTVAFYPLFMKRTLTNFSTQFDHLTERYSLFTLLLFGEAVIAVAQTINSHHLRLESVFYFMIIALLFTIYIISYERGINRKARTAGLVLIHVHYFIFVGINLMTALLELFILKELGTTFFAILFDLSAFLFVYSVLALLVAYPRKNTWITIKEFSAVTGLSLVWVVLSFLLRNSTVFFLGSLTLILMILALYWWRVIK